MGEEHRYQNLPIPYIMEYCDEKTINACTNRWKVSILVGCVGHLDLIALGGEVAVPALYHLAVITKLEKEKRSL